MIVAKKRNFLSIKGRKITQWNGFCECKEKFPKGFMIISRFCYEVKLKVQNVLSKAKINSLYYQ